MPGPTASQAEAAIEPGSVPHGDRQVLEEGLAATLGGPAAGAGAGGPPPGAAAGLTGGDPLSQMMSDGMGIESGGIPTSGMSVGPGEGRVAEGRMNSDPAQRLRQIALGAKMPSLRFAAERLLRRMSQGKDVV